MIKICSLLSFLCLPVLTYAEKGLNDGNRLPPKRVVYTKEELDAAKKIEHIIVILQENWSFDSLYGKFPGVEGIDRAEKSAFEQVDRKGQPYSLLPLSINSKTKKPYPQIPSTLPNAPFDLEPYLPMTQVTGDPAHRFYNEQRQINGGMMNGFAAWGNTGGFVMSYYDISQTRMGKIAQEYTICDHFFHSCYGSSMAAVIMLFSGKVPLFPTPPAHLIIDTSEKGLMEFKGKVTKEGYAVEDLQPYFPPYHPLISKAERLPPQTYPTIGDLLSGKEVSWGWYAEGWDDALSGNPSRDFPFHHQAPSYFSQFAPDTKARKEHLFDLKDFYVQLKNNTLPSVCFIRSIERHSEHPGEAPLIEGLNWCADLIETIQNSAVWKTCAIIVTYDENGGRWDHVSPPVVDAFGPGTRVPGLIISPFAKKGYVDSTCYETLSILKFIEERWDLPPLSTRDFQANNLLNAFDFSFPDTLSKK